MTELAAARLRLAARLFAYPSGEFFNALAQMRGLENALDKPMAYALLNFSQRLLTAGPAETCQRYVAIFDHTPGASLYLTWHRYGNDRSQGKAMAALNGLYRTAGFEPIPGEMPDYLPRMLEFLSVAPDWAIEALLDGFGPELNQLLATLQALGSDHAPILALALEPLKQAWPDRFEPRTGPDPTRRPMAQPETEQLEPLIPVPGASGKSLKEAASLLKKTGA